MNDVNQYIDQSILHQLYKGLEQVQYSRVACAIRIKTLQCLRELLPLQEPPDFYERVLKSFDNLAEYFDDVCREDAAMIGPPCDEIVTFRRLLQSYSFTTEALQISYFRDICQVRSLVRPLVVADPTIETLISSLHSVRQLAELRRDHLSHSIRNPP